MDRRPSRIVIQRWRPEVILEEDEDIEEDDDETFTSPPAAPPPIPSLVLSPCPSQPRPSCPPGENVAHLQVPSLPPPPRRRQRKKSNSMVKLIKTLQLMQKWSKKKEKTKNKDRDLYMRKRFLRAARRRERQHGDINVAKKENRCLTWFKDNFPLDPNQRFVYWWFGLVSWFSLYNCFLLIGRETFDQLNDAVFPLWVTLDYMSDIAYILDIVLQFVTSHLNHGLMETRYKVLAEHYIKSRYFWVDLFTIIPTDIFYLIPGYGPGRVFLRLNRTFKVYKLVQFVHRTESTTTYPNLVRVSILIIYITLIIHWNACVYFLISEEIGFGSDTWVYPALTDEDGNKTVYGDLTRQYLFSFYWSTLTLTTIGELPGPRTDWEYFFVIMDFMVGVLIFATVVGMVGGIISSMNLRRNEFQHKLDNVKHYMRYRSVGKALQLRVIKWFDYLWSNRHTLDEDEILHSLPDKLRAEIAIHVHFDTLRRVEIFDDCEASLLEELVLKLKPQVFSPGDYICRKGDIGKEMYIVKQGQLEVVADDGETILTILTDGDSFGEISVLSLSGCGNRRTANVRSVGYSELFCLSKTDLLEALLEYPEAREALEKRGRKTLMNDKTLTKSEQFSSMALYTETGKKGRPTSAIEALNRKVELLESNVELLQSRFASLIGEYSAIQHKLRKKVRVLEGKVKQVVAAAAEASEENAENGNANAVQ